MGQWCLHAWRTARALSGFESTLYDVVSDQSLRCKDALCAGRQRTLLEDDVRPHRSAGQVLLRAAGVAKHREHRRQQRLEPRLPQQPLLARKGGAINVELTCDVAAAGCGLRKLHDAVPCTSHEASLDQHKDGANRA